MRRMHMPLAKRYIRSLKRARHRFSGVICLSIVVALFGGLAIKMGAANMLNTVMHTAHDLLFLDGRLCHYGRHRTPVC